MTLNSAARLQETFTFSFSYNVTHLLQHMYHCFTTHEWLTIFVQYWTAALPRPVELSTYVMVWDGDFSSLTSSFCSLCLVSAGLGIVLYSYTC